MWRSLIIAALLVGLSGCGGILGDNRMEAWRNVRTAEEATKQAKASNTTVRNPTLKITNYDQNGKILSVTEMDLQPVVAEVSGNKGETGTPMPKGEFAENAKAVGESVLSAPSVVGASVGASVAAALKITDGGGVKINADTANIDKSFNTTKSTAIANSGAATSSASGTMPPAETVVVEPSYPPVTP